MGYISRNDTIIIAEKNWVVSAAAYVYGRGSRKCLVSGGVM